LPWRFDGDRSPILTEAPELGQDNSFVYRELLGLTQEDLERMVADQIIY
jgi:hypothetical protein